MICFTRILPVGLLLLSLALTQCEKTSPEKSPDDNPLVFGEPNTNLEIQLIDSLIVYQFPGSYPFGSGTLKYSIDFDDDEIIDIIFSNYHSESKWGRHTITSLKMVNSVFEIAIIQKPDTIFSCGFADLETDPDYPSYDSVFYTSESGFSCMHTTGIDKITSKYYPQIGYHNDTLNVNSEWLNESTIPLTRYVSNASEFMGSNYEYSSRNKIREGLHADGQMQFISIRKKEDAGHRYGWIKIRIFEYSDVHLYEMVFEEK